MTEPGNDAVSTAHALTAALDSMSGELRRLNAYGRRNRKLIRWLIAAVALLVLLTAGLGLVAFQSHNASVAAQRASASAVKARQLARVASEQNKALCLSGNRARAQQVVLWEHVLHSSERPQNARRRRVTASFETYLHRLYQPRDCAHLTALKP